MLLVNDAVYKRTDRFSLHIEQLNFQAGEIVSLIGPNGSGKSTFLRLIARLLKLNEGSVILEGKNIAKYEGKEIAKRLSMLPQIQNNDLDLSVKQLVTLGRHPHKGWFERLSKEDEDIIEWALQVTNMSKMQEYSLLALSGGERQRAWIAMTLAQRPKVLLLDEPTTYLDIVHQLEVMEIIQRLNKEFGMTIIMVLHDINQAAAYSHRIIALKDGEVGFDGNPQCVLCEGMFQKIFGIDVHIFEHEGVPFFKPAARKDIELDCKKEHHCFIEK